MDALIELAPWLLLVLGVLALGFGAIYTPLRLLRVMPIESDDALHRFRRISTTGGRVAAAGIAVLFARGLFELSDMSMLEQAGLLPNLWGQYDEGSVFFTTSVIVGVFSLPVLAFRAWPYRTAYRLRPTVERMKHVSGYAILPGSPRSSRQEGALGIVEPKSEGALSEAANAGALSPPTE